MKITRITLALMVAFCSIGIQAADAPKDATEITRKANAAVLKDLPFNDRQDFEDAQRGFIATIPNLVVKNAEGREIYNLPQYDFVKKDAAPATVNPSTWRQSQLTLFNGLFKVTDRVYQIRSFDISNMTIIEGDTGLILIDPLISPENSKTGLDLYYQNRPKKPVVAVIYTHSHIDHYGGVKGVVNEADVKSGKVKILAPDGFLEEAISENIYAGTAMSRRAAYQYGMFLSKGERGQVGTGLGVATSLGVATLIPPTDLVKATGETRDIDGVKMEFLMAPNTEAPTEFMIYFPQFKVLDTAEDATHTLHNLYTLRGAQVRDSRAWWKTLNSAIERYGDKTDVVIAQHHWPMWEQGRITTFLQSQRDTYKYLHDQVLNLANKGFTSVEIAEQIKLPDSISKQWYNRGYYGSVNHNAKAIYQRYLGWYDSNPAHLYNLPPTDAAKRYVKYMGGAASVIKQARQSFAEGDYRWVAEVMNQAVFADPKNQEARNLGADALEQLGYQSEDPTWRNEFLTGAFELRNGVPKVPVVSAASLDTILAMPPDMMLDYMGIRLNGPKANGKSIKFNWVVPETKQTIGVELRNSVLIYSEDKPIANPDATLTADKAAFGGVAMGGGKLDDEIAAGKIKLEGNAAKIRELIGLLDNFDINFNIVTP